MHKAIAPSTEVEIAAKTHAGMRRTNNEDAVVVNPDYGFCILADGMGGYNAGEVASRIAASVIGVMMEDGLRSFDWQARLEIGSRLRQLMHSAIQRANRQIMQAARGNAQFAGMGTTVVMSLFYQNKLIVGHVGDSRMYRFRDGKLSRMTRDHSLLQEQIDAGLMTETVARALRHRNSLTRAVGVRDELEIDTCGHSTKAGDLYLLCSDGVSDMLTEHQIAWLLATYGARPEQAYDELIKSVNEHGGHDNSSVILVKLDAAVANQRRGFFGKIFKRF